MRSYAQHLLASLWKRRTVVLLGLAVFTVTTLMFHYTSVNGDTNTQHIQKYGGQRTLRTVDGKPNASDQRIEDPPNGFDLGDYSRNKLRLIAKIKNGGEEADDTNSIKGVQARKIWHGEKEAGQVDAPDDDEEDQDNLWHPAVKNKVSLSAGKADNVIPIANKETIDAKKYYSNGIKNVVIPQVAPQEHQQPSTPKPYIPKHRLVHLDLKGAPPKISYLEKIFALVAQLGATGILIEYEDMFPYDGYLKPVAAHNHYSKQEVRHILKMAEKNKLEVIPLVQTFGHLEFVLKLESFKALREVPSIPQALCPSRNESLRMVEQMIDQVVSMHPKIRWIHIGCDEVFQLGECSLCNQRSRDDLFLWHVAHVASYVRSKHHLNAIIWDDMLHHFSADQLRQFNLGNLVEPMLWTYVEDVYRFISPNVWSTYAEVFPYLWAASAFKGAFGETLSVPNVKRHLDNNLAWLEVLAAESPKFKEVRGLAITGWQRYDHFAVLCELLPAAVPSLAVSLLAVSHGYFNQSWQDKLYTSLQCMKNQHSTSFIDLENDPYLWHKLSWCFFPGNTFFKATERLQGVRRTVHDFLQSETVSKAWLTEYNVRHNFSSVTRIDVSMQEFMRYYYDVETLIKQSRDALREVYDEYTVAEWIEQNVYPMLRRLELLQQAAESMKRANTWPARPFDTLPDLQRFNIGIPEDEDS